MSVFGLYAQYYDLLYRDKNYAGEAVYVAELIRDHTPYAKTILELGCGTGIHAAHFADMGFDLMGVDRSEPMLEQARTRKASLADSVSARLNFEQGNVGTFRAGKTFDVVLSLFHVFSYQVSNHELRSAFETAANHLNPGGLLIFDYWYGPAVLTQQPEVRVKRLENDTLAVIRVAEPEMNPSENRVTVNYWVHMVSKTSERSENASERHDMRYLFIPEIEAIAAPWFISKAHHAWATRREPKLTDWGGVTVMERSA
jgi:SAM-dependent methyltransferase